MARLVMTGNLVADVVRRQTGGGDAVVQFDVADTARVYDRQAGEWKDGETTYMRCVAFRDIARHIADSAGKGSRVTVTGDLKPNNYEKDGEKRYGYQLEVDDCALSLRFASYARTDASQAGARQGRRAAQASDQPF